MPTEALPTAEGDLGRTPLAHLLVYVLDKQLTGALVLEEPSGVSHRLRLEHGAVVKILPGDGHAKLGELLIEAGAIDQATLEGALSMPGLLGDALLLAGCVERDTLERTVERQFMLRMVRLFGLSSETRYAYYDGRVDLVEDGAPSISTHPLAVLWAGVRAHAQASTMMEDTLARLDETLLRLHPTATIHQLAPTPDERAILEHISAEPLSLAALLDAGLAPAETLRWMVYALVITRNLDLGLTTKPLCAEETPPPAPTPAAAPGTGTVTLARIRLRAASHRTGAAAPDQAGEGERTRPPRVRKRGKPSQLTLAARRVETPSPMEATRLEASGAPVSTGEPPTSAVVETDPSLPNVPAPQDTRAAAEPAPSDTLSSEGDQPPSVPMPPEGQPDAARPAHALYRLASSRITEGDLAGALAACQLAREVDPTQADYAALAVWIRSLLGGADLAARVAELDALLEARSDHVQALFYRGYLKRRIGDEQGAERDLRRTLELDPNHVDAAKELRRIAMRKPAKRPSGLFKR